MVLIASFMLALPLLAQDAISELSHFWEMDLSEGGRVAWDYHGNAHGVHNKRGTVIEPQTSIFGSGVKMNIPNATLSGGLSIPGPLIDVPGTFTYGVWARYSGIAVIISRRPGTSTDTTLYSFRLYFLNGKLRLQYYMTNGSKTTLDTPATGVADGELALVWFAYDNATGEVKIAVNGNAFTVATPAAPFQHSLDRWLDIGHVDRLYDHGSTIGRMMFWDGYIPDETERGDIYNGGAGRAYPYFNAVGFTPPAMPLQVTLQDANFARDIDLAEQGLYYLRPYPCKNWGATFAAYADYCWVRSTDHTGAGGGVWLGGSSSPEILPASWTKIVTDAGLTAADPSSVTWVQVETPHLEYNVETGAVHLFAHAVNTQACGAPCVQVTHVWTSTNPTTWTWQKVALANDGDTRNHTGYAIVHRRGPNDWIAQSLTRDSANPLGTSLGLWTSSNGLDFTFSQETKGFEAQPSFIDHVRWNYLGDSAGLVGARSPAAIIALQAGAFLEGDYPYWLLFEHDGTLVNGDWLQDVRTYQEGGTVWLYAKWSFHAPSTIRLFKGTLPEAGPPPDPPAGSLQFTTFNDGLTSLTWLDEEMNYNNGSLDMMAYTKFIGDATLYQGNCSKAFDAATVTHTCTPNGKSVDIEVDYSVCQTDTLCAQVTVDNNGDAEISEVAITVFGLTRTFTSSGTAIDVGRNIPAASLEWGDGRALFWLSRYSGVVLPIGHSAGVAGPTVRIGSITVSSQSIVTAYMRMTLDVDSDFGVIVPEAYQTYRTEVPPVIQWRDRRPIVAWFLADTTKRSTINPRGYLQNAALDVSDQQAFSAAVIASAEARRNEMLARPVRPQGVILWDIEGQEFPHAVTYVGDPRVFDSGYAPEMDAVIDTVFKTFRDAGFRVGLTIRPQFLQWGTELPATCTTNVSDEFKDQFVLVDQPYTEKFYKCDATDTWTLYPQSVGLQTCNNDDAAILALLTSKTQYAVQRWGVSLVYVDSAVYCGPGSPISAEVFRELQRRFPRVLFMPEQETLDTLSAGIPFSNANTADAKTLVQSRYLYPSAAIWVKTADCQGTCWNDNRDTFVYGQKWGDIQNYNVPGQMNTTHLSAIETMIAEARVAAGQVTINDQLGESTAFAQALPVVNRSKSCYPQRLVVEADDGQRCSAVDSPCVMNMESVSQVREGFLNALGQACSWGPWQAWN